MNEGIVNWLIEQIENSKEILKANQEKCNVVESAYNEGQINAFEACLSAIQNS